MEMVHETLWKHVEGSVMVFGHVWTFRVVFTIVCKSAIGKIYMTCSSTPLRNAKVVLVLLNTKMDSFGPVMTWRYMEYHVL